jgi:hypothetical protein
MLQCPLKILLKNGENSILFSSYLAIIVVLFVNCNSNIVCTSSKPFFFSFSSRDEDSPHDPFRAPFEGRVKIKSQKILGLSHSLNLRYLE